MQVTISRSVHPFVFWLIVSSPSQLIYSLLKYETRGSKLSWRLLLNLAQANRTSVLLQARPKTANRKSNVRGTIATALRLKKPLGQFFCFIHFVFPSYLEILILLRTKTHRILPTLRMGYLTWVSRTYTTRLDMQAINEDPPSPLSPIQEL